MEKGTFWKPIMVGDFHDCQSCDEPCGHVWFVNAEFNAKNGEPVCINTVPCEGGVRLVEEELGVWCHRDGARQAAQEWLKRYAVASQGPLYKLKDFCKGGRWEENIVQHNRAWNEKMSRYGIPCEREDVPEKIFPPHYKP